jgi:uncharacterized protein YpbB
VPPCRRAIRTRRGTYSGDRAERHDPRDLELFRSGLSLEAIAKRRQLKISTLYTHFERCIEVGEVSVEDVVSLDHDTIRSIEFAIERLTEDAH